MLRTVLVDVAGVRMRILCFPLPGNHSSVEMHKVLMSPSLYFWMDAPAEQIELMKINWEAFIERL